MREVLLTEGDVAKILGVSVATVRRERIAKKILHTKVRGSIRFTQFAVDEYVRSNTVQLSTQKTRAKPFIGKHF